MIFREETLLNVIRSVTRNGRSIILTAILALILVYMFSLVAFLFLKDDFLVETDPPQLPPAIGIVSLSCIIMIIIMIIILYHHHQVSSSCIITIMHHHEFSHWSLSIPSPGNKFCPVGSKDCDSYSMAKSLEHVSDSIANKGDGEESGSVKERACDTLIMCIVTTLNQGLRNGGGIGDVLRRPSSKVGNADGIL